MRIENKIPIMNYNFGKNIFIIKWIDIAGLTTFETLFVFILTENAGMHMGF